MKKVFRRTICACLAASLFATAFVGCNKSPSSTSSEDDANSAKNPNSEFVTLKLLQPGSPSRRMEEFLDDEFKQKMKEELNLGLEIQWIPWDQYWNTKDVMINSNEQIDWYWDGGPAFNGIVSKKACVDITDLVNQYGQDLKKVIPQENFEAYTVDGKLMGIPSQTAPTSEKFRSLVVRQDLVDQTGITEIKTVEDIQKVYEAVKEKNPDIKFASGLPNRTMMREFIDYNFTCAGLEDILTVDEDTHKVDCVFLTDGFKEYCKKIKDWNEKGWIPEELTVKAGEDVSRFTTGLYLFNGGAISRPIEQINELRKNVPNAELCEYIIAPEKPRYKVLSSTEVIYFSPTAKYPERAMQMVNWMFKSQENYLFSIYGVEGKDYEINNGRIKLINTDPLWYEWMFRNKEYMMFEESVSDEFIDIYSKWDEGAKLSCQFGFVFDGTPIEDIGVKVKQAFDQYAIPLINGYVDYETELPKFIDELKKAGIDGYIAEYQKQLDAYIASK